MFIDKEKDNEVNTYSEHKQDEVNTTSKDAWEHATEVSNDEIYASIVNGKYIMED